MPATSSWAMAIRASPQSAMVNAGTFPLEDGCDDACGMRGRWRSSPRVSMRWQVVQVAWRALRAALPKRNFWLIALPTMNSPAPLSYCPDLLRYQRRLTREVMVGNVGIGGSNPIRVQSMITSDTRDTPACVAEVLALAEAGCEIVRITAQTRIYAANLENIAREVRAAGCQVPLVADIHFKPDAALEAAKWVEKIRVNPGNYADKKKFEIREYTDAQYEEELERIRAEFSPLVKFCKEHGRAMRIGTNHGSLSDRIMNRYGDTPLGMVESALEFARIARDHNYHDMVFSMKASNPKVMIEAYRLLVARLHVEGPDWNYPIHLGVTEAGDGEDGRIKSAIGIGSLLADGIGDTVRVSLTEDAVHEIPVARALVEPFNKANESTKDKSIQQFTPSYNPFNYERRRSSALKVMGHELGAGHTVRVFTTQEKWNALAHKILSMGDYKPEIIVEKSDVVEIDPTDEAAVTAVNARHEPCLVTVADSTAMEVIPAFRLLASKVDARHPVLLKDVLHVPSENIDFLHALLPAARNIGSLLCDGIGDAVLIRGETAPGQSMRLAYNILQAAGARIFKTDYVACPSCGRTLFNLQSTTQKIRAATGHLKGVRIAVMGCIVNGPGEMADANFGYVGGAPGKINLYVGKTPVKFNIPENEAVERLIDLIREHGKWIDAPALANTDA
jgi:(E)-4-hydroxy-3-methylbut-2-enyl-diphosphate synthase